MLGSETIITNVGLIQMSLCQYCALLLPPLVALSRFVLGITEQQYYTQKILHNK